MQILKVWQLTTVVILKILLDLAALSVAWLATRSLKKHQFDSTRAQCHPMKHYGKFLPFSGYTL